MSARTPISRRSVLTAAGVGAVGVGLGLTGCAEDPYDGDGIYVARAGRVPDDPDPELWRAAPKILVSLGPQDMALPMRLTAAVAAVSVQALHDGERVSFRLEWSDTTVDDLTVEVDHFRDACAVMLVMGDPDPAVRAMGSTTAPATLLHWKADWQRDVDAGQRQGLEAAYPNRVVDFYPPLVDVPPMEVDVRDYEAAGATQWLPAYHVGNPIARGARTTAVEKLIARGFGSSTSAPTQDAHGRGVRVSNGWTVVVGKPLGAIDGGEAPTGPGGVASCAFAVWSGADRDAGSKKSPATTMNRLVFEP